MTDPQNYPDATDQSAVGTYPASAKTGGGYFYDDVLEYRVWVHDAEEGDDYFFAFASYVEALQCAETTEGAEQPLVLIRQQEYIDEPEPGELHHVKERRDAEWCVEWLADGPRKPGDIERFIASQPKG